MKRRDAAYFTRPGPDWQKRYEALRASFVERLPARIVAARFGYTPAYIHFLRHQFTHGRIDFAEPPPEGKARRRGVSSHVRNRIRTWREQKLSAGEIAQLLSEEHVELSVRTVERILAEEGFPKLPRRTRLKVGLTAQGAEVPQTSQVLEDLQTPRAFDSTAAGAFIFAPFLAQLRIDEVVRLARLPGTKLIPALNYFLSFLALKLLGNERFAHVGKHAFDSGLGLFAGLNVLPKCTAMSTYSYGLDEVHLLRLQSAFVKQGERLGLYDGKVVNLDFHTVPHYGEESVLEKHWAATRGRAMKGALTLFGQDSETKLLIYSEADILSSEADDKISDFLSFWRKIRPRVTPMVIFDSGATSYSKLSELNQAGIKFITLRKRGANIVKAAAEITHWKQIHIPHPKRKFPNPLVHESMIELRGYKGMVRQIIAKGNGHEKPSFLITNDTKRILSHVVGDYARRWRIENGIAEAVKFFHLNALSSPILVKVHFDCVMTMVADTLYSMLAKKLRGFEDCDAPKIYRHFIQGNGVIEARNKTVTVTFPRRAHNPILRAVPWGTLPSTLPWLADAQVSLKFR
jgi:hypothetical protein